MLRMITIRQTAFTPPCPFSLTDEEDMECMNTGNAMMIAFGCRPAIESMPCWTDDAAFVDMEWKHPPCARNRPHDGSRALPSSRRAGVERRSRNGNETGARPAQESRSSPGRSPV